MINAILELNTAKDALNRLQGSDSLIRRAKAASLLLADILDDLVADVSYVNLAKIVESEPRKIERIKKLRKLTGWGLKESKEFVEMHFASEGSGAMIE